MVVAQKDLFADLSKEQTKQLCRELYNVSKAVVLPKEQHWRLKLFILQNPGCFSQEERQWAETLYAKRADT